MIERADGGVKGIGGDDGRGRRNSVFVSAVVVFIIDSSGACCHRAIQERPRESTMASRKFPGSPRRCAEDDPRASSLPRPGAGSGLLSVFESFDSERFGFFFVIFLVVVSCGILC